MKQSEILNNRPSAHVGPREVLKYGITEAALEGETALFDVLPGLGKSRSAAITAKTHAPISVFTNLEDNYNQFERWCQEEGIEFDSFPRSHKDCLTLQGNYPNDGEAEEAEEAYYDQGWPAGRIHKEFNLPCQKSGECGYIRKIKDINTDASGLLVGHYTQAYVERYVNDRVVFLDEDAFEEFYRTIRSPAKKAQEFVDTLDDFPFDKVKRLEGKKRDKALRELEKIGLEPADHAGSAGDFDARAPLIAYAIYGAKELDNGLNFAELPGGRTAVFDELRTPDDTTPTLWLLDVPDFSGAEAVIGLDATPCLSKWRKILGDDFTHYRLFDNDDRNQYLRKKGYEFIQLNSHAWPAQGGNLNINKCEAYLREIYRKHGKRPDVITGKDVLEALGQRDLDHLWNRDMHYGNLRGRNKIKDSELLAILGSPSRSYDYYRHITALFGESAEREDETKGMDLSFGSDIADDILDTLRRGGVFQAAMRAGRDNKSEATIYIATGLTPDWLETKAVGEKSRNGSFDACIRLRGEAEKKVIDELQQSDGISGREIARQTNVPKSTVTDALNRLQDDGLVEKKGAGRGSRWHSDDLDKHNIAGSTDLSRMTENPYGSIISGSRPFPDPVDPREPKVVPSQRYPDWMRGVQRQASERKVNEQLKRASMSNI